ncbi:hypothetical protein O6H91_12G049800 [Diphasiastrum complanatum]|uniref:Uncharacterized protein n=1 Tax=Diphasiastrum complanatum TaxID=34168 RepID=A0ACC2C1L7_DIPCM|nr:hypothetical protein O6H91_12G049800 [Diphasiastrum complanatum]
MAKVVGFATAMRRASPLINTALHSSSHLGLVNAPAFPSPPCEAVRGFSHFRTSRLRLPEAGEFGHVIVSSRESLLLHKCDDDGIRKEARFPYLLQWQLKSVSCISLVRRNSLIWASSGEKTGDKSDARQRGGKHVKEDTAPRSFAHVLERKTGYFWLLGPILNTVVILIPTFVFSLVDLLQHSYLTGLGAVFGMDLLFVLSADAFFVLTDKMGHHQQVPGGPFPSSGPWEYTGYPKGLPHIWHYVSYAGVAIAVISLLTSIFVGRFPIALVVFSPYLALILAQVAYERLLSNDRLPTYPLVPIIYTLYRFRQLARGMEIVSSLGGGNLLALAIKLLTAVWTLYLAMHLAHLPWLYSTWNANRAI